MNNKVNYKEEIINRVHELMNIEPKYSDKTIKGLYKIKVIISQEPFDKEMMNETIQEIIQENFQEYLLKEANALIIMPVMLEIQGAITGFEVKWT